MSLYAHAIQPFISWLHANPHWALFFTFIISLSESLAILGAIIPGSVTMTAIGILAGSGVIRIDMTLLAAILGAIAGDSLSYAIGYMYSDKILYMWPFKKYPQWIAYGKNYFARHGGKSVFLGRFIGPLRAIMPLIAGIMHLQQGRFLIANVLSAIGWSVLYVMPGVLIGAASSELSAESATKLFLIIMILLVAIWFLSKFLQFLFNAISIYLKKNLHSFWLDLKKHPFLYQFFYFITPKHEKNHYPTVIMLATTVFSFVGFILLLGLHLQESMIQSLNSPIHILLEGFRGPSLQAFFIFCTQFTSMFTMACLFVFCFIYLISQKHYKVLIYLCSTIGFGAILSFILNHIINSPAPQGLIGSKSGSSFPALEMSIATAFYGFIYFYVTLNYNYLNHLLRTLLFIVLGLSGLGSIFLGDYWFSDVIAAYCLGLLICMLHCLEFRKTNTHSYKKTSTPFVFFLILVLLGVCSGGSTYLYFKTSVHKHTAFHQEYDISEMQWWNQKQTILPLHLRNRLGKPIGLLNIQYLGDLDTLVDSLKEQHWVSHNESFYTKLMQRINSPIDTVKLPLLDLLFENKRPQLLMTLNDPKSKLVLELRIWNSEYFINEKVIWIGSIRISNNHKTRLQVDSLNFLLPSLKGFDFKKIQLLNKRLGPNPYILLIKPI